MKTRNSFYSVLIAIALCTGLSAQDSTLAFKPTGGKKKANGAVTWIVGVHGVVADDDGRRLSGLFDVSSGWNFLPYPSRVSVERSIAPDWRVEVAASYIKYGAGNKLAEKTIANDQPFFAFDANAKYDLNALFGETSIFDPFTVSGLGFTHRSAIEVKNTPTANLGLGFNLWVYKGFGLAFQTTAKIKILPKSSNYLMHSVGIVYNINYIENGDPKKGSIRETR